MQDQDIDKDAESFKYNNLHYIEEKINFRESFIYGLYPVVTNDDINELGDVIRICWHNKEDELVIEENRVYTRTQVGEVPLDVETLTKQTTLEFIRYDNTRQNVVLDKIYNEKQRKDKDQKSRNNLLEKTRELTGGFIYQSFISAGRPQDILPAINEALAIFNNLNSEVNQYKFERINTPLVNGITNYIANYNPTFISPEIIAFILNQIDVEYYTQSI